MILKMPAAEQKPVSGSTRVYLGLQCLRNAQKVNAMFASLRGLSGPIVLLQDFSLWERQVQGLHQKTRTFST